VLSPAEIREGLLVLEDGSAYEGSIVSPGTRFGEVVFNTSMTGYQEILTDPSYRGQIVVMTQPHIGNYGTAAELGESRQPWVEAFVAHQFTARHSGSGEGSLPPYLREHGIPALHEIDTRSLVRRLRERGAMRGVVTSERSDIAALVQEVRESPPMEGRALVDEVTCAEAYSLLPEGEARCRLAVYDYGVKSNILRSLLERGAALEVLPARTPAARVRELDVDGVVLSNGPGDPEPLHEMIDAVAELVAADYPVLGICLGHQLLGLALGGKTRKLKFGHHGGNQPVKDLATGTVSITSQNHGFMVDPDSLPRGVHVSQVNLNDGTVEGLAIDDRPVFSVQYHPEAAPGPRDATPLFERFLERVTPRS
jgi:carbamoyl-phosphate synthase small subunit